MNTEIIFKLITVLLGSFTLMKLFIDASRGRKSHMREEYKFAKEFLNDVKNNKEMHPFAIEKGFQAIACEQWIEAKEVDFVISLEEPTRSLNDFIQGNRYIELKEDKNGQQIVFKQKYQAIWHRRWRKLVALLLYFCFCLLALSPWLLLPYITMNIGTAVILLLVTIPVFGSYAYMCLSWGTRVLAAERLVKRKPVSKQQILL
ncbi:hypothetical protein CUZ56_01212 [Saezia sanguinis]|uniref:Uncharacterized protein n=1 Tax=Saezia sanguinis TaxID=1965230 RepID=A0A433SES2_9BURK|nr:hypothetical protein [Saezia sanguinis]RUS67269.1 hypothetical protein CUZ56_01212 [Saezia sanguinis]